MPAPKRSLRVALTAAIVFVLAAAGFLTSSGEAQAASTCNNTSRYWPYNTRGAEVPSVGYNSYNTNCVMGKGAMSSGVAALQRTLKYCYGKNISVDGEFGPQTETALRQAQQTLKIADDGVYGPQTRSALKWYAATGTTCNKIYF